MINVLRDPVIWSTTHYEGSVAFRINELLAKNLNLICNDILKYFPNVTSIYLLQSFARGEGSVLVTDDENLSFLSDYDLLIIADAPFYSLHLAKKRFEKNFLENNLKNIELMHGHPIVELKVMNHKKIMGLPPSLFKNELKSAKCIYGKNFLKPFLKIDLNQIPITEGFSLLLNRIFGALLPFEPFFIHSELSEAQSRHLSFESAKLLTGCRDSLLILSNFFGLTETEKQECFRLRWSTSFSWLNSKCPEFLELTEKAYSYRLMPCKHVEREALSLWLKSIQVSYFVLELYFKKLFHFDHDNWVMFSDELLEKNYYNYGYKLNSIFSNISAKMKTNTSKVIVDPNKTLMALILLVFSIDEQGINELMLTKASEALGLKLDFSQSEDLERTWGQCKKIICENYISPFMPSGSFLLKIQALFAELMG